MDGFAYVALGSNLGRREHAILRAARRLQETGAGRVRRLSSLYETDAVGMGTAPPFINAVLELVPLLTPSDLLQRLKAVELELGRTGGHNQSREIDLDLIAFAGEVVETEFLTLPHPRYAARAFVLVPLAEIAPGFRDPHNGRTIEEIAAGIAECDSARRISGRAR
ncbi:MAG TPA: 2-amino-4-hydroxy-6-hydroxymethyldihydropteridine diphosphokinase [Candidatus Krumholzibacteria bacterium]|nr:2-amino-4-hydroxy-6-hydroxymethyldihydropteridine diphosphokinase [Candidatus Krumholzibacteria bacterium]